MNLLLHTVMRGFNKKRTRLWWQCEGSLKAFCVCKTISLQSVTCVTKDTIFICKKVAYFGYPWCWYPGPRFEPALISTATEHYGTQIKTKSENETCMIRMPYNTDTTCLAIRITDMDFCSKTTITNFFYIYNYSSQKWTLQYITVASKFLNATDTLMQMWTVKH